MENTSSTPNAATPTADTTSGAALSSPHEAGAASASTPTTQTPTSSQPPARSGGTPIPSHAPLRRLNQPVNRAPAPSARRHRGLEDEVEADEWDVLRGDGPEALIARAAREVSRRQEREEAQRRRGETQRRGEMRGRRGDEEEERRRSLAPIMDLIGGYRSSQRLIPHPPINNLPASSAPVNGGVNGPVGTRPRVISPPSDSTLPDVDRTSDNVNNPTTPSTSKPTGKGNKMPGTDTTSGGTMKPKGARAILDDSIDRAPAHFGQPDESKLTISIKFQVPDPNNPGELIDGPVVVHRYRPRLQGLERIDWNDRRSVTRLNAWREQVFRRTFGESRKTREYWIDSEKAEILRMAAEQLQERNHLDFNALANRYNRRNYLRGVVQRRGERQVAEGKNHTVASLKADRVTPWRTASALRGQKCKWDDFEKLVRDAIARALERASNGTLRTDPEEEDEIPDPNPYVSPAKRDKPLAKRKDFSEGSVEDSPSKRSKPTKLARLDDHPKLDQQMVDDETAVKEALKKAREKNNGQVQIYTTGRYSVQATEAQNTTVQQTPDPEMDLVAAGFALARETFGPDNGDDDIAIDNEVALDIDEGDAEEGVVEEGDVEEGGIFEDDATNKD